MLEATPDAIVHQATALAELNFSRNLDRTYVETSRLRTEGADALLAAAGEVAVGMGTEARGASNAKAKRELGWEPRFPSWREGFTAAYATAERRKPDPAARASQSPSRLST